MGGRTLSNRPIRHGRARPGHPRGAVPGHSESFRQLDDVDDREKPGHDGSAVVILARQTSCLLGAVSKNRWSNFARLAKGMPAEIAATKGGRDSRLKRGRVDFFAPNAFGKTQSSAIITACQNLIATVRRDIHRRDTRHVRPSRTKSLETITSHLDLL